METIGVAVTMLFLPPLWGERREFDVIDINNAEQLDCNVFVATLVEQTERGEFGMFGAES